jgi:hypothetical protein
MSLAEPTLPESKSPSRRALLGAGLGALAATVAGAVARPDRAQAANGEAVIQGADNKAGSLTTLRNIGTQGGALRAFPGAFGIGVEGVADAGTGVAGSSKFGSGVEGFSQSDSFAGVRGEGVSCPGVFGIAASGVGVGGQSEGNSGVSGRSVNGYGVRAASHASYALHALSTLASASRLQTDSQFGAGVEVEVNHVTNGRGAVEAHHKGNGPAVWATATNGYAVRGSGRVRFEKVSGVATIAAGLKTKTVTPGVNVTSGSFVLLTPKANIGTRALWFTTNATDNKFTIRMSSSRTSNTPVAWLLLG